MKSKKKGDYRELKSKIYFRVLLLLVLAIGIILSLRFITRGNFADWFVSLLENNFYVEHQDAMSVYQSLIRNNLSYFMIAAVAIMFIILCRFLVARLTKYFDEINNGIALLISGENKVIELSPEMSFMEQNLNVLKQTLEKRQQDAKLAEQQKNDVVMYLAHDIKTPLTSVIGYLSLLDEAPDMPTEQKAKYVHITLGKAYRLEQLIDEFFEITRYNLQTITLSNESIDLYYMLVQMTDEFYPQMSVKGKLAIIHAPEDLTVYGDPDKLARVFNNILKNAIAYSEDNSTIDITASCASDRVSIVFRNTGIIPQDRLSSIFEKFYRLDSARSSANGGAGLGLAIAKEIIVLHGGQIFAESDHRYTTFTVEFPVLPSYTDKEDS